MDYDPRRLDVLLGQMLREESILRLACERLEGPYLARMGANPAQVVLFKILKEFYLEFNGAPDYAAIHVYYEKHAQQFPRLASESCRAYLARMFQLFALVDERSERLARLAIREIHDACVITPAIDEAITEFREDKKLTDLRSRLDEIDARGKAVGGGMAESGLLDMPLTDDGVRVPTYIPWLDQKFGGGAGPVSGVLIAIIAPQGCGKTTLGIQLAVSQALNEKHALLVLAEEGLTMPMRCKLFGCATGVDFGKIMTAAGDTFGEKVTAALHEVGKGNDEHTLKKIDHLNHYLHVVDLARRGGLHEALAVIETELAQLRSDHKVPSFVYVDWAGIIADAIVSANDVKKEAALKSLSYGLSSLAYRTNTTICISQQMAGAQVQRGAFAEHDQYCAADCKGFTEPAKYVFVISPPVHAKNDKAPKRLFMTTPKSRDDQQPPRAVMELRGATPRFVDVSDNFEVRGKTLTSKGADPGRIPT
jgi:hypothetical protein